MCEGRDERKYTHDFDMSTNDGFVHFESSVSKYRSLQESILADDEGDSDDDNSFSEETISLESENQRNELQKFRSSDTDNSHDDGYQRRPKACQESSSIDGYENSVKITIVTQDFHRINDRFNSSLKPKMIPKHKVTTNSRTCTPWYSMMTTLNEFNLPNSIGRGRRSRSTTGSDRRCPYKLSPSVHQANFQYKSWGDIVVSYQWMCDRLSQQVATTTIFVDDWNNYRKNTVIALTKNKDMNPFMHEDKIREEPQLIGRFRKRTSKSMNWNVSIRNEIFSLMSRSNRQNNADDDDETASSSNSSNSSEESESMCMNAITSTRILGGGIPYKITRTILVGWLYKKGTGMDILQSFSWKVRYAKLCLAYVYCHEHGDGVLEVPLLCLYWYESSQTPCTVIVLDTAVVLSVQEEDIHVSQNESNKEILTKLNDSLHAGRNHTKLIFPTSKTSEVDVPSAMQAKYFFELRHATSKQNCTLPITRSFATLSTRSRDEWVYRISEALLIYNKTKQQRRQTQIQAATYILRSPQRFPSCVVDHAFTTVNGGRRDLTSHHGQKRIDGINYQQQSSLNAENKKHLSVIDPLGSDLNGVYGHRGVCSSGDTIRHSSLWQEVMPTSTLSTNKDLSRSNLPKATRRSKSTFEPSERPPILPIRLRPSSPTGLEIEVIID